MYQGIQGFFTGLLLILLPSAPVWAVFSIHHTHSRLFSNVLPVDTIVPVANNGPDDFVFYDASDSTVMDVENQRIYLYHNAVVKYGTMELTGGYIEFSFKDFTAKARGIPDSLGVMQERPVFKDGENELTEDSLAYNFHSKRGISYGVRTQQGDAYLLSEVSKRQSNEWVHIKGGMLTTCDKEHPHYHFRLSKAIVVPDDKVVSGPLYMKVGKVPTPLALPFGFFPNKRESTQGILLPGYGRHDTKGYFLNNLGYYIPLPPYLETKFLFDIYTRGSTRMANNTRYKRIYRYDGNFDLSRTVNLQGIRETNSFARTTEFAIGWNHRQDPKARVGTTFNANVRLGSRNNYRNTLNSSQQDFLSSTFNSSVQWTKTWKNKYNLGISARHSQNTSTGHVDVMLPAMSFSVNRFVLPLSQLRGKNAIGKKWYEQIGVTYAAVFENLLSEGDSALQFNHLDYLSRKLSNGVRQDVSASTSFKWFKGVIAVNPSFNYNEFWGIKIPSYRYGSDGAVVLDTLSQFVTGRNWNVSTSANTRVYATYTLKRGKWLKAVRHVLFPSVGVGYTPYYNRDLVGYYGENYEVQRWNPFDISRFQPANTQEAASVNFGLKQNLEAKFRDRSNPKPTYNKVTLIDQFTISTRYNVIADSLNWSNVSMNANTTILRKYSLSYRSSYSLYDRDSLGHDINTFLIDSRGYILRLENTSVALDLPLAGGKARVPRNTDNLTPGENEILSSNPSQFIDFNIPWSLGLKYNVLLRREFNTMTQTDDEVISQGVTFVGDVTLFTRWNIGVNSGYDFTNKEFTATMISLHWDLHCWELSAQWIPSGVRKSYMVQLNVKSPLLQDLKLQRRGNYGNDTLLY